MGKTKTAFLSDSPADTKTGKEAYEEKMRLKAAKEAAAQEKSQVKGVGLKGGERIKFVGADLPPAVTETEASTDQSEEGGVVKSGQQKKAKVRGKKYKEALGKFDRTKRYSTPEAVSWVKQTSYSKFDGSVEVHAVTRAVINKQVDLPFSSGKTKKVEVADEKTIEKLSKGKIDFDVLLATADMMPKLVPFARSLGPKGLMPNPKNGTIIKSAKDAEKFSGSSVTLKTQKEFNIVHIVVGKVSQKESELTKNIDAVLDAIDRKKIERAFISPTMGPSVKLQV